MRTRMIIAALAALILCPAPHARAQWMPRRIIRRPVKSGPVSRPVYSRSRSVQQSRRAKPTRPIVRKPMTPRGGRAQDGQWHNLYESQLDYRAYDLHTSDASRQDRDGIIPW